LETATSGLCVTLTSQVVVYAPAERADPLPLLRFPPFSLVILACLKIAEIEEK
jgi:hypothetical protein